MKLKKYNLIVLILILSIVFAGCGNNTVNEIDEADKYYDWATEKYYPKTYDVAKFIRNYELVVDDNIYVGKVDKSILSQEDYTPGNLRRFTVDYDLAVAISNSVFEHFGGKEFMNLTHSRVYEIEVDGEEIWYVRRTFKSTEVAGGDLNVIISKKNGQILKVWGGE